LGSIETLNEPEIICRFFNILYQSSGETPTGKRVPIFKVVRCSKSSKDDSTLFKVSINWSNSFGLSVLKAST
jgi:hypothetical protein